MVIRDSIASYARLCVALIPLIHASGCHDLESDDVAAAEDPADFEQPRVVADLEITKMQIRFTAGDQQVELVLIPNTQLLAPNAVIVRDGVPMSPAEAGLATPYRGYVAGDPNSWIRVSVSDTRFEGLIYMDENLWDVRESDRGEILLTHAEFADYIDSPSRVQHTCASSDAEAAHASYATPDSGTGKAAGGCKKIDIALVADYTHVDKLGGVSASEHEMIKRINEVDGLYRADLDVGLAVQEVRTFSKSGGPSFNSKKAGTVPLSQFADYRKSDLTEVGLAHLFMARTKDGTVGKAYIATTCSNKAAGVSNYLGKGKSSTIVVAHEIGHNFGAKHDAEDAPYIMAPSVDSSVTEFSKNSESKINSHVGSVSCFEPCDAEPEPEAPEPEPEQSSCAGHCGEKSPAGCWCDDQCGKYDDCCEDKQDVCD
jgi:hypothetical protein